MRAFLQFSICSLIFSVQAYSESDIEVVEQSYANFLSGDAEGWAALHTDDFVWTILGDLPHSGQRVGTQAGIDEMMGLFPFAENIRGHC